MKPMRPATVYAPEYLFSRGVSSSKVVALTEKVFCMWRGVTRWGKALKSEHSPTHHHAPPSPNACLHSPCHHRSLTRLLSATKRSHSTMTDRYRLRNSASKICTRMCVWGGVRDGDRDRASCSASYRGKQERHLHTPRAQTAPMKRRDPVMERANKKQTTMTRAPPPPHDNGVGCTSPPTFAKQLDGREHGGGGETRQ